MLAARSKKNVGWRSVIEPSGILLHGKQAAMKHVTVTVVDGRRVNVEPGRFFAMQVVEHSPALQVFAHAILRVLAHNFEEWMARSDPLRRSRPSVRSRLVEDDLLIFAAKLSEARLQTFAEGPAGFAGRDRGDRR